MTTNRRERRAEAQKAVAARSSKIAARAANKRRAARPENKTEAQEINRRRARRNFNIPDDPTALEHVLYIAKQYIASFMLLLSAKSAPTYLAVVFQFVLCLTTIFINGWMRRETTTISTSLASEYNTSLALAAWDLMSLDM